MTGRPVDLATWPRAETFRFFRAFERPHFSVTARLDVSRLMAAKADSGTSLFRACLWALGAGLNAAPELRTRFRGDTIVVHDRVALSPTVSMPDGGFRFAYLPWLPDWPAFDCEAERLISAVRAGGALDPNTDPLAPVAYLSCMPWVDFTALTNALPGAADCVPRVAWGRIVPKDDGFDMAAAIELHHAVADGRHAGTFFEAAAAALGEF